VQCTQAFSLPNILVRDAHNEECASLFFLLDPSEGLASAGLKKNEVCRFHAAPGKGSRVMRSRAVGSEAISSNCLLLALKLTKLNNGNEDLLPSPRSRGPGEIPGGYPGHLSVRQCQAETVLKCAG
jgi:hypothetical protein